MAVRLTDGPTAVGAPNIVVKTNNGCFTFWTKLNFTHITLSVGFDRTERVWQDSYRSRRTRSSYVSRRTTSRDSPSATNTTAGRMTLL